MLDEQRLREKLKTYEIDVTEHQFRQIDRYAELLVAENEKVNLTAITKVEDVEVKHMLDCLIPASLIVLEGSLVDVGSGAGFPGMVMKIQQPELEVTLMEPTGKRCNFLRLVAQETGTGVDVVKERAEEAARKQWRESFDHAVARAVAALPVLCEYCLPLVKVGGTFVALKGEAGEEVQNAQQAIEKLGGRFRELIEYELPDGAKRSLVVIEKVAPTPRVYPRNGGKIAKKPL